MQDFKTLISQALANGIDPDTIAKQMTDAFNEAYNQKEEAEAKAKAASARKTFIEAVEGKFWEHIRAEKLKSSDAAALAFLVYVNDSEYGKSIKDVETLKAFFEHLCNILEGAETSFKVKQRAESIADDISHFFWPDQNKSKKVEKPQNKSKDIEGGTDRKKELIITDEDRIKAFLSKLV